MSTPLSSVLKYAKMTLRALLRVFALLVLALLGGVFFGLSTETGRLWLLEQGRLAAAQAGVTIQIDEPRSTSLGRWQFDHVAVAVSGRKLVAIDQLHLRWRPSALLQSQIWIDALTAERFDYFHSVAPAEPHPDADEDEESGTWQPMPIVLRQLAVDLIAVHHLEVQGRTIPHYQLQAAGELFGQPYPLQLDLDLTPIASDDAHLRITTQALTQTSVRIAGSINESPGGLLGSLLQWPQGESLKTEFNLVLEKDEHLVDVTLENLAVTLMTHALEARGHLMYNLEKSELQVPELMLLVDGKRQMVRGGYSPKDLWAQVQLSELSLNAARHWLPDLQSGVISGRMDINWLHSEPDRWPRVSAVTELQLVYLQQKLQLQLDGALDNQRVTLRPSRAQLDQASLEIEGLLDWQGDQTQLQGRLRQFDSDLLKPWPVPLPEDLRVQTESALFSLRGPLTTPQVTVQTRVRGEYQQQAFDVKLDASGSADNATFRELHLQVQEGRLQAEGTLDWRGDSTHLDLAFEQITDALLSLLPESVLEQYPQDLTFALQGSAQVRGPLTTPAVTTHLRVQGTYAIPNETLPYRLELNGAVQMGDLNTLDLQLEHMQLWLFDEPTVDISGHYTAQTVDLSVHLERLPTQTLAALGWQMIDGEAAATLRFVGSLEEPHISGFVEYRDQLQGTGTQPVAVVWRADLTTTQQGQLQSAIAFTQDGTTTGQLQLALPLALYLQPQDGPLPLALDAQGELDLGFLRLFIDPDVHRLAGKIHADLQLRGNLDQPDFVGTLQLTQGLYNSAPTGTQLDNIQFTLEGRGTTLELKDARADTGDGGYLALQGTVHWDEAQRQQPDAVDLRLRAHDAMLLQRRELQGELHGELQVTGSFNELWVKGQMEVAPLNASIDSAIRTNIPEIQVTEIDDAAAREARGQRLMPVVHLDVVVLANQQAYLRGRGLDTELTGRIALQGTLDRPEYSGVFTTRRGRIEIFGRIFVLENGEVRFSNDAVTLRIPAVYTSRDLEVRAEVSGPADAPQLKLTSVPAMPEDEILSRLIFGRSVQEIGPLQALQLAAAVHTLTSGGGLDPVGRARSMLGVDTLTIDTQETDEGSGISVGVGKYINERVYLQLERTPNPTQPWQASVQIELTSRLTLESGTSDNNGVGAELFWRWDY